MSKDDNNSNLKTRKMNKTLKKTLKWGARIAVIGGAVFAGAYWASDEIKESTNSRVKKAGQWVKDKVTSKKEEEVDNNESTDESAVEVPQQEENRNPRQNDRPRYDHRDRHNNNGGKFNNGPRQ